MSAHTSSRRREEAASQERLCGVIDTCGSREAPPACSANLTPPNRHIRSLDSATSRPRRAARSSPSPWSPLGSRPGPGALLAPDSGRATTAALQRYLRFLASVSDQLSPVERLACGEHVDDTELTDPTDTAGDAKDVADGAVHG